MAVPSRRDIMIKNRMNQRNKNNNPNQCLKQFDDCPIIPDINEKECRLCPFNKHLK